MKKTQQIFIIIVLLASCAPEHKETSSNRASSYVNINEISVIEFVEILKDNPSNPDSNSLHNIIMARGFQDTNWITTQDIKYLAKLVDSEARSKCIMSGLSNTFPREKTTLGNQILFLLYAYRNKLRYPYEQNHCGSMDKVRKDELIKWVNTQI